MCLLYLSSLLAWFLVFFLGLPVIFPAAFFVIFYSLFVLSYFLVSCPLLWNLYFGWVFYCSCKLIIAIVEVWRIDEILAVFLYLVSIIHLYICQPNSCFHKLLGLFFVSLLLNIGSDTTFCLSD